MKKFYNCCCGMDVHQATIKANLRRYRVMGQADIDEVQTFGTMTQDLQKLKTWLKEAGCSHIAMESTGVFWKPIFNVLGADFEIILVNARHYKAVPGRKTDVEDCQWLAELLQHGLLKGSFIPPQPIRELRDLTRERRNLVEEKTSVVNRIHKVLQDANIKLTTVITDIMGKSGLEMLERLVEGKADTDQIADCARGKMKSKKNQLKDALCGEFTTHHRFLLSHYLDQIRFIEKSIEKLNQHIQAHIEAQGKNVSELIPLMTTIRGVNTQSAQEVLAEIGADMNQFPSADHLSSWAGICPGNNETGGKRKNGKTTKGCRWLRATLGEMAWAASRTKGTYLSAQYRRIARRRGKKKAVVAVGHTMLVIIYHMIKHRLSYNELGEDYFNRVDKERLKKVMIKRLEKLGYDVELTCKEEKIA
ncbi:MAG TPA: IS110 family transposase [Candidatus Deferrimicrobium sp.]|nr:IS110 family transposase [Candidatus Deferrimicrobium sp.]